MTKNLPNCRLQSLLLLLPRNISSDFEYHILRVLNIPWMQNFVGTARTHMAMFLIYLNVNLLGRMGFLKLLIKSHLIRFHSH